jgi:peptide deformylase
LGIPRSKRPRVVRPGEPGLDRLVADLADTLADHHARTGRGRGIAANQIGEDRRVIVIDVGPQALVNPCVTWESPEVQEMWDNYFSLPSVMVRSRRPASISVAYHDFAGVKRAMDRLYPPMTELLHHEIDHLDGVLMVDRMIDPRLVIARAMREVAATRLPTTRETTP